jgi:hypothetical protein
MAPMNIYIAGCIKMTAGSNCETSHVVFKDIGRLL